MKVLTEHILTVGILLISCSAGPFLPAHAENAQFGTPKESEGTRIFHAAEHSLENSRWCRCLFTLSQH